MTSDKHPRDKSFTVFRSAAEEAATKTAADEAATKQSEEESCENEGGHMSSTSGRVKHVPGSDLPFVATLTHHKCDATEHSFATMREAEAFIERNTPVARPALSSLYDQPASNFGAPKRHGESTMNDEDILARLKVIDQRLRQISTEDAASVLAGGLARAGIHEQERLRLIAETERILDELDGKNDD
jgi:hypothetical protein